MLAFLNNIYNLSNLVLFVQCVLYIYLYTHNVAAIASVQSYIKTADTE